MQKIPAGSKTTTATPATVKKTTQAAASTSNLHVQLLNRNNNNNNNHAQQGHHQRQNSNSVVRLETRELAEIVHTLQQQIVQEMQTLNNSGSANFKAVHELHLSLKDITLFSFVSRSADSTYNTRQNVSSRYKHAAVLLLNIYASLLQCNEVTCLFLENEVQLFDFLRSIAELAPAQCFQQPSIAKFLVTQIFLQIKLQNKRPFSAENLFQAVKLFVYGIQLPIQGSISPLHKAVFDDNQPLLQRLCSVQEKSSLSDNINLSDALGLTPLLLAVRLRNEDCARICTSNLTDPMLRALPASLTPLELAVAQNNVTLLKPFVSALHGLRQQRFYERCRQLDDILLAMPNFTCDIRWETVSSFIPFLKRWTPNDVYSFKKLGKMFRIDMGLLDQSKSWKKGEWSLLYKNRKIVLVDHATLKKVDLMGDLGVSAIEARVEQYLSGETPCREFALNKIEVQECRSWRGELLYEEINALHAQKFQAKGSFAMEWPAEDQLANIDLRRFKSYAEYAEFVQKSAPQAHLDVSCDKAIEQLLAAQESATTATKLQRQTKQIQADVWLCDKFALKMKHITPILEILALPFQHFQPLKDFFRGMEQITPDRFPIRIQIPLFLTVNTLVEFQNFEFEEPDPRIFEIDEIIDKQVPFAMSEVYSTLRQATGGAVGAGAGAGAPLPPHALQLLAEQSYRDEESKAALDEASEQFKKLINEQNDSEDIEDLLQESTRIAGGNSLPTSRKEGLQQAEDLALSIRSVSGNSNNNKRAGVGSAQLAKTPSASTHEEVEDPKEDSPVKDIRVFQINENKNKLVQSAKNAWLSATTQVVQDDQNGSKRAFLKNNGISEEIAKRALDDSAVRLQQQQGATALTGNVRDVGLLRTGDAERKKRVQTEMAECDQGQKPFFAASPLPQTNARCLFDYKQYKDQSQNIYLNNSRQKNHAIKNAKNAAQHQHSQLTSHSAVQQFDLQDTHRKMEQLKSATNQIGGIVPKTKIQ